MKLGLFGGTFDPVHNAHLFIAEAARALLSLDRMIFLPTLGAHHRLPPRASLADRLAMLRLAIASNAAFALDLTDCDGRATGYTADLIPRLRHRYPADELTFLAGGDSLVVSPWRRFDEVLTAVDAFAIAPRGEEALRDRASDDEWSRSLHALLAPYPPELRAKVRVLDLPPVGASATLVREQLARGGSVRYVVPEPVQRFIDRTGIYRQEVTH